MAERKGGEEWIRHVDYCVRCDAKTADNKVGLRNEANWGLTGRQLHLQVRKKLGLEPKVSLRMCPFRPWYRHFKNSFPVPEAEAISANDVQCTALLGTTILYYTYVHLRDVPSVGMEEVD